MTKEEIEKQMEQLRAEIDVAKAEKNSKRYLELVKRWEQLNLELRAPETREQNVMIRQPWFKSFNDRMRKIWHKSVKQFEAPCPEEEEQPDDSLKEIEVTTESNKQIEELKRKISELKESVESSNSILKIILIILFWPIALLIGFIFLLAEVSSVIFVGIATLFKWIVLVLYVVLQGVLLVIKDILDLVFRRNG